uniref:Uncharacterized protein n=1 Tax=Triticum urartu TaxID=4572 RepID=A0A8R7PGD2_TRIUA
MRWESWTALNHGFAPFISHGASGHTPTSHRPLIIPLLKTKFNSTGLITKPGHPEFQTRSITARPSPLTTDQPILEKSTLHHGQQDVEHRRGGPGRRRGGRRGAGAGAVRGGLLLERGAGVPAAPRRGAHGGGLLAGALGRADLPRRLRRRHRPLRGGARALRPQGVPLRRAPRRLLGQAQPHHAQQTGQRRRDAVPVGHLLLHGGAGAAGQGVAGGEAAGVEGEDRDGGPPGEEVLPRRGLPPAVPGEGRPVRQEALLRSHPLLRLSLKVKEHCPSLRPPLQLAKHRH